MTQRQFKKLMADMRYHWNNSDGLIVLMKGRGERARSLRICGARSMNDGLVIDTCLIWDGDDELVYNGPVGVQDMKKVLTRYGVCGARFCTSRNVGSTAGSRACYADYVSTKCGKCNYCGKNAERLPV